MSILDTVESMTGQQGNEANTKVAGGMMQALEEHPGGLAGLIDQFKNNGMASHVQNWATGQQQTATPEQVQQGVGNSGFIDNVAAKAGVSPSIAAGAMATLLPLVISHFTYGGQQAPPSSGFASAVPQILSKLL